MLSLPASEVLLLLLLRPFTAQYPPITYQSFYNHDHTMAPECPDTSSRSCQFLTIPGRSLRTFGGAGTAVNTLLTARAPGLDHRRQRDRR